MKKRKLSSSYQRVTQPNMAGTSWHTTSGVDTTAEYETATSAPKSRAKAPKAPISGSSQRVLTLPRTIGGRSKTWLCGTQIPISFIDDQENDGVYFPETKSITIADHLAGRALTEALLHEFIECTNHVFDLKLKHQTIQTLGVALAEMLTRLK